MSGMIGRSAAQTRRRRSSTTHATAAASTLLGTWPSDRGGERAAAIYTLIGTAKLNGVDPQAWLADVLGRINDHPASRLDELLPWHWKRAAAQAAAA
jgi:hypothetical protein